MSTSLRVWYSAVFGLGAAAITAGIVLAPASPDAASERAVSADVVLVSTNPMTSLKSKASANEKWQSEISAAVGRLQDALKSFNEAAQSRDFVAMQASCGRLGVAARDMGATPPAPRQDITAAIQGAVDNFELAGSKCDMLTAGAGQDALQGILIDVQNGFAGMQQAEAALADATAPKPAETPIATPLPPHIPMGGF